MKLRFAFIVFVTCFICGTVGRTFSLDTIPGQCQNASTYLHGYIYLPYFMTVLYFNCEK